MYAFYMHHPPAESGLAMLSGRGRVLRGSRSHVPSDRHTNNCVCPASFVAPLHSVGNDLITISTTEHPFSSVAVTAAPPVVADVQGGKGSVHGAC
jgi:hypothetical protein